MFRDRSADNSLDNYHLFLLTGEEACLDRALEKYPSFAQAIASKAKILTKRDPERAKDMFAIASRCYANSAHLHLKDLYSNNAHEIGELFGESFK